ncbi:MAG: hypothetical protein HZA50_07390 [Planctomycetes bacterium]|nr:hypothetical protein [Planctomycetota bacterium]
MKKKKEVAIEFSASLLPPKFRNDHKRFIRAAFRAEEYVYFLQDISNALYRIFLSLISAGLWSWITKKNGRKDEIDDSYFKVNKRNLGEYQESISKAQKRSCDKKKKKVPRCFKKTLQAHKKTLVLVKKPRALKKKLKPYLKKINKKFQDPAK